MADATKPLDLDAIAVLIDDARTEIIQATKVITEAINRPADPTLMGTLNTIVRQLDTPHDAKLQPLLEDLQHTLNQRRASRRLPWWLWPASIALAGLLGIGVGWQAVGCPHEVRMQAGLMSQMDALLVERFDTLPSIVQGAITGLYAKSGFQSPAQRKGKK